MSIELRPLGVACNLSCHYCYQNPQRDAGNHRMTYDLEKMKAEAARIGGPFTLFGGEPLLMRFEDLEHLFAWGLEKFGGSSIQTNGILIEDRHIAIFRRYKVKVGISIDGPGELNDARWHRGLEKTRKSTAQVEAVIERLCREYRAPGLIITLHKGNATSDKLSRMSDWIRRLHAVGVMGIRLHLLEVDHESVRTGLALSARENIEAVLAFADVQESLPGMRMDLFEDMERLLNGDDAKVGCIWRACDPYTTNAVQGIEGNGQSSNCGRTNKEGIGFIKADRPGFERYVALYNTPQSDNGCAGCRFFLMCKGQCPGTSIDGDWRNRTEHCQEWKHLFGVIERRMILAGKHPLTIQPIRFELERRQLEAWARGSNPSISRTLSAWRKEIESIALPGELSVSTNPAPRPQSEANPRVRISWVSESSRNMWQNRLQKLSTFMEDMTVHQARRLDDRCAARLVPSASFDRLKQLALTYGLDAAILPANALPSGICARPPGGQGGVFITGTASAVATARRAWSKRSLPEFHAMLAAPTCCLQHGAQAQQPRAIPSQPGTTQLATNIATHPLLSALGIAATAVLPCRLDCPAALNSAEEWLGLAHDEGFAAEVDWLRGCLGWALSYSELHGVAEVKTPLFKMCFQVPASLESRLILRLGSVDPEEAATGLSFPYSAPVRRTEIVQIESTL